jgi:hypothetical protein
MSPPSEKPATIREAVQGRLLPPSGDDHARAHKVRFSDLELSQARLYPPLTESRQPNSRFFGAGSWSIGWRGFSNTPFTTKC